MKIIIIGAGIAGLTLGLACHRAGIDVKIYDKASKLTTIGGGVLLWPHGLRYLKWLGLEDCIAPYRTWVKGCQIIGYKGNQIFSEDYAQVFSLLGGEILPIDRSLLQASLLNQFPPSLLSLSKNCIRVYETDEKAEVYFSDGHKDEADLIVGADGIHSHIRKIINKEARLEFTNYCWWGGIVDKKHVPHLHHEVYMMLGQLKMFIVWPMANDGYMWYLPCKIAEQEFVTDIHFKQTKWVYENWHPDVMQLITASSNTQRFHLPIYALPPQPYWTTKRVVLIGDAAHALGPVLGQGASQAIEDAFCLFQYLQTSMSDLPHMLKKYEALRKPKYMRLAELENQAAATMISDSVESLEAFESYIQEVNLTHVYQDIIPLVNEEACLKLVSEIFPPPTPTLSS